jgi:hypothetical protein
MEPYLWSGAMVKARLWFEVGGVTSVFASRERGGVGCARGAQPYLECADSVSGDKMIDRVLLP